MPGVTLYPFLALAALGLALSVTVHIASILGIPLIADPMFLGLGIFVVWLPAVLVGNRAVRDFKRRHFWKAALRGCPTWMSKGLFALFAYALVNFALMFQNIKHLPKSPGRPMSLAEVRGFTGHFMVFYATAFALLYSGKQILKSDPALRCPAGHPVPPSANYCEVCGARIERENQNSRLR